MRIPRLTTRRLAAAAAIVGLILTLIRPGSDLSRRGWLLDRFLYRSLVPGALVTVFMLGYLTWAVCRTVQIVWPINRLARWLIATLLLILVGTEVLQQETSARTRRALRHAECKLAFELSVRGEHFQAIFCGPDGCRYFTVPEAKTDQERDRMRALAEYHALMENKYERAAHYPWLPIEPDPPRPE